MPIVLDDVKLTFKLGSPRPYAAELNVDFNDVLCPEELTALIVAERLEEMFQPRDVMGIMRWMGNFLSTLEIKRSSPPEMITILDYRWVVSLSQPLIAWDVERGEPVLIKDLAAGNPPPEVSVAISLFAIWKRRVEPLCDRTSSHD